MSIIYNVLGSILKVIFEVVGNYGLAIVIFTIFAKTVLLPLTIKQTKSSKAMQDMQPRITEIQEKYKNKPEKQQQEILKLYQESNFNPMAGCLPMLIQMPIIIGLFSVLREPVKYGVFASAEAFAAADQGFLWLSSLTQTNNISMALLSGISAYFMQKVMTPPDQQQGPMKTMTYMMTAMSFFWGFTFPAGLALYWTVSNIYTIAQYYLVMNPLKKSLDNPKEEVVDGKKPRTNTKKQK